MYLFHDALVSFAERRVIRMKKLWLRFWREEDGVGVVELILILVVLIALVLIFKEQLTELVEDIFKKVVKQSNKV